MKYSNELKVGLAIVLAIIIFIVGIRYFEDVPLFRGTDTYFTAFDQADGLIPGNPVRINGVRVGAVEDVWFDPETRNVRVEFHLDRAIRVPEGSYAEVGGISALGSVHVSLELAPPDNPSIDPGSFVPGRDTDLLTSLIDEAPTLVGNVDTLLTGAAETVTEARALLANPQSNLNQTLIALQQSAAALESLIRSQQVYLTEALVGVTELTGDLSEFTEETGDSVTVALENLNEVLAQLNQNLDALENVTANLDSIAVKINTGDGTLGLLLNDPTLYRNLTAASENLNELLLDVRKHPRRYLKELEIVDIF